MDAAAYMDHLISHLVGGMRGGGDTDVDSVLGRVEGAAEALAAAGLLPAGDVHRFSKRVLDALEGVGAIEQLSISRSSSFTVAATAGPETRPGSPRSEGPPQLLGVVPVAETVALAKGHSLALLSLNRWSSGFDLLYAVVGGTSDFSLHPREDHGLDLQWTFTDDRGMRYQVRGAGGGGGAMVQTMRVHAIPALSADVASLTIRAERSGTELFSATVTL